MANDRIEIGNLYGAMIRNLKLSEEIYDGGEPDVALDVLLQSYEHYGNLIDKLSK